MVNQRFSFRIMGENARSVGAEKSPKRQFLFHFTIAGVAFAISLLYQAMRPIMRLGGFVASGGPYAIEHPAPSWVWIMPVSILFGMVCFFVNCSAAAPTG